MAKKAYVRNSDNTAWVELASATTDLSSYLTISSASTTYQPIISGVSNTELGYLDGVTSAIQTQINAKSPLESPTFTGTVVLPSTTSIGTVSSTEIGYLNGVTSALQTQLNAKAPLASPVFTGTPDLPSGTNIGSLTITSATIQSTGNIAITPALSTSTLDLNSAVRMSNVYDKTTTSAANMLIATTPLAYLYRSTASSGRWKNSIEDLSGELNANKLLELPVHQFKFNNDYLDENDQRYGMYVPGFIAEEVAEVYPIAAEHDEDGLPSDWNSRLLLPPMLKLIQDQATKIEELELRISVLEA